MPSAPLRLTRLISVLAIVLCIPGSGLCAGDDVVFGPRDVTVGAWGVQAFVNRFACAAGGEGALVVSRLTAGKRFWGGFVLVNERLFTLQEFLESGGPQFAAAVNLRQKNVIGLTVIGEPGAALQIEVRAERIAAPPQATFEAVPASIKLGETSTLQWTSTEAETVSIAPEIGNVAASGSKSVSPQASTAYTLTATGPGGSVTRTAAVTVTLPAPTASLSVSPAEISAGETVVLSWSSTYAQSAAIEPGIGPVAVSGTVSTTPLASTTYTLTVVGAGGSATASATVSVRSAPVASLTAAAASIPLGGSTTLSWSVAGATAAYIEPELGAVPAQGSAVVSPSATTTYALTASGAGGSAGAKATVAVTAAPAPLPPGSFGQSYQDQVPADATLEAYDPKRFALVTGLVRDAFGGALEGVAVSIVDYPDYGTAATGAEGRFSLPVEGGGNLTVKFAKPGFISAQRQLYVPWNDTALVETVSLLTEDPAATVVSFDGSAGTVVTHRGSEVIDASGTRAATIVFTGDNKAYLTDTAGNKTLELKSITTRATEYTTPESMPAKLPPSSAFTWCAELAVDGAERVQFEKPVAVWVENFLGFPVGEVVPVGYYDRDKAVWVPMKNGVVVELLDTDGDGVVDALDADGDGQPDDLNQDGQFKDEVRGLTDSQKYTAGGTFWRAEVKHFSPIDLNWPFGLPPGATPPNAKSQPFVDVQKEEGKDPRRCLGSFVEEKGRIFHEDIPIPGTDLKLHYTSSRTAGYKPGVITIPASGDEVPANLVKILVRAEVAGRKYEVALPPTPNQVAQIEWDGVDYLGKAISGTVMARIQIGFVYYGVYYRAATTGQAFGQAGLSSLIVPTRQEIVSWTNFEVPIASGSSVGNIAEGWTLAQHHYMNPNDPSRIYKGDGGIGANNAAVIETFAGNGISWAFSCCDTCLADKNEIGEPYSVITDTDGYVYIFTGLHTMFGREKNDHYALPFRVSREGIAECLAGFQWGVSWSKWALDRDGNLYRSSNWGWDNGNYVLKIFPSGLTIVIAGVGLPGFSGDGGPATDAKLNYAMGIALDQSRNIYVADMYNNRVRKIDVNGIITTVAGNGSQNSSGDGGRALDAGINRPVSVTVDGYGNLLIAESGGLRIRKVAPSGNITTVVGDGTSVFKGNGIPATQTGFQSIDDIAVDHKGNLYIASATGNRVYKVNTSGVVTTIAGTGAEGYRKGGFDGDGGPANRTLLNYPSSVAVDGSGIVYIADELNSRVRKIRPVNPRLIEAMNPSDNAFTEENGVAHIMSASGLHMKTIDYSTGSVLRQFEYGTDSRLIAMVDQFGNKTLIERDGSGLATAIISPEGIRTALLVDNRKQLLQITYPDGRAVKFDYSPDGLVLRKTEPAGISFRHFYDAAGRLAESTDEEGGWWKFSNAMLKNRDIRHEILSAEGGLTTHVDRYDSSGAYQSTITDAAGAQTIVNESADGFTVASTLACGLNREEVYELDVQYKYKYLKKLTEQSPSGLKRVTEIETAYADAGADGIPDAITKKIKLNGRSTVLVQDILMAKKTLTSAEGRTVVLEYDPNTLVTERVQVPGLLDANYNYDGRGRLVQTTVGQRATAFAYTAQGFLGQVTDPLGRTTSFSHDALGRVREVSRPDQSKVRFDYDANGSMTVLVNPSGVAHTFGYNKVNHKSAYTTPLSGSYLYRYDKDRRPTETVLPSGRIVRNVYDKGRLARTETPEGNLYYNYLCGSKVGSITKDGEGIGYTYDGSLLTSETLSGSLNQTLSYIYDNDFARVQAVYAGAATGYGYDKDGLLTQAGAFAIARDAGNGLPVAVADGRLALNRGFNGYGELASQAVAVGGKAVSSWSLLRDATGRITRRSETVGGVSAVYDYLYDVNGRLLKVLKDNVAVEEYAYDENGTRIYEMNTLRGIPNRSYQYSDEDHLLKAGEWAYQYDLDGFLTTKTNTTNPTNKTQYFYSSRGELLTVLLPDGHRIDYLCDPLGRRIAKKVNGVVVEKYLWQGLTRLLAVYDGSNTLRQRFEYADDRLPLSMTMAGATYYFTYDQVGSLRLVADASGNVVKRISYDAFGNILKDTNPGLAVPFGFAGGLHDRDTGLVRFGFRDYDPEVGRWTAKDPIGFAGGDTDLYGYVLNDPINFIDPAGEFINFGAAGIGAAIGAAVGATNALFSHGDVLKGALSGAAVGSLAGLTFGSSIIVNSVIGAGIGAITDIASQRYSHPCGQIDETTAAISALAGAFGGGAGTAMLKGGMTAVDAALFSGALSGGTSMGLNHVDSSRPIMTPYK